MEVYLVLEEDGTEVDDDEYFQTIEGNTMLMLLLKDDIWSPEGPHVRYSIILCFQLDNDATIE